MNNLLDIIQYDFAVRALIAGLVISILAPLVGMFLVVRRYALLADTLSHISLLGVAVALLLHWPERLAATVASVVGAIGIERLRSTKTIGGESVLAIFLSGSLAASVVLIGIAKGFNANLFHYLFGSISTVSQSDLYWMMGWGILVVAAIVLCYKELFLISFNEELAAGQGLRARQLNMVLMILSAITVALSIRMIGALLISALLVLPVVSANQFGYGFRKSLGASILFSVFSVFSGLLLSYAYNLPSGGTIVLIALLVFIFSITIHRKTQRRASSIVSS